MARPQQDHVTDEQGDRVPVDGTDPATADVPESGTARGADPATARPTGGGPDGTRDGAAGPPGPDGLPVLGSTLSLVRDPFAFYERLREDYDADLVTYTIAGDRGYMLTAPEDIERVLVTEAPDFRKGRIMEENLGKIIPDGLVVTEGEQWQADRSLLQPMFYRERIESYAASMTDASGAIAAEWTPGEPVRVDEAMRTLTLDVLAETLLDIDVSDRRDRIARDTETLLAQFDTGSLSAFLPLWVPTPRNLRGRRALADFHDLVDDIIAERRRAADLTERDDLCSLMLTAEYDDGSSMDTETIRDQLMTFLVAGHETTSLALTYTLYLLAHDPDRQARLHAELDAVLGDEAPTAEALFDLDYLDDVFTEALRLYPPAFVVFRESTAPKTFQGYEVPEGSLLSLPQWNVHRDERWYDEPEAFRPERWTDAFEEALPDYAYYPFGGGPRGCIGNRFATMEAKLALATMCQRYRFEPVTDSLDLSMRITLQPDHPVEVRPVARS
jgi:cytochrome P450